jgi:hypothetical protein
MSTCVVMGITVLLTQDSLLVADFEISDYLIMILALILKAKAF